MSNWEVYVAYITGELTEEEVILIYNEGDRNECIKSNTF